MKLSPKFLSRYPFRRKWAASEAIAYGYNARSELTSAVAGTDTAYNYGYAYDNIGNRKSSTESGTAKAYASNALNQYTDIAGVQPTYDADGNATQLETSTGTWTITWNGNNRPVTWLKSTGASVSLYYTFDGNKNVSEVFYLASQNKIGAHYEYTPFGGIYKATKDSPSGVDIINQNPFRFSSEFYDPELNLVYYNYRHYSPELGRFLSRDPIAEQSALNLYAFAGNNGITNIDFLGNFSLNIYGLFSRVSEGVRSLASFWERFKDFFTPTYYPTSICDGYNPEQESKCCRDGKLIDDPYPPKAHAVCVRFVELYNGTRMSKPMACVAECLIKTEGSLVETTDCAERNNSRMNAHLKCYEECKFFPHKGIPRGGEEVGIGMLSPDWKAGRYVPPFNWVLKGFMYFWTEENAPLIKSVIKEGLSREISVP